MFDLLVDLLDGFAGAVDVRVHRDRRIDDEHDRGAEFLHLAGGSCRGGGGRVRRVGVLLRRIRAADGSHVQDAGTKSAFRHDFLAAQDGQEVELFLQINEELGFLRQHVGRLARGLHLLADGRDDADGVGRIQRFLKVGTILEEQRPVTVGRIGEGQRQLHLPFHRAILLEPAGGLAEAVRADLHPVGAGGRGALVDVIAAERGQGLALGRAGRRAELAAGGGEHALEQGLLAFLQQGLHVRHRGLDDEHAQRQRRRADGQCAMQLHLLSSSKRSLASALFASTPSTVSYQ
ncbi:hypothetical protein D3C71_1339760 [compost metagenome]